MQQSLEQYHWWQKGIIYQIYPRSFQDTDQDGTGDLRGIIQRLDYLKWLGVQAIWLSPIFPSPMHDFGYDISDYTGIEPLFGSMQDFDELLELTHQRDMRLILDLVPNHTSIEHPWFQEARSSRDNPKRDWYIWKDALVGEDGERKPPNNWQSVFGGSAWHWDEKTPQYYYHAFLKEQPDLNWRNPEVQQAMLDVMRFWLDKGVDGFRVDVIWHLMKDDSFRDNPLNPDYEEGQPYDRRYLRRHSEDQPEVHEIIADMRKVIDAYDDRLLIGEIYLPIDRLVTYYGKEGQGVQLPFNFQLIQSNWDVETIYQLVNEYEDSLLPGNWPNWVLGNHDKSRVISRVGASQARLAAVLLFTLRGTPIMYYGDEIGMHDVSIPPDRIQDLKENTMPGYSRDPERTPMQWNNESYAGFSEVEPWLPVADDYRQRNVAVQKDNPDSLLSFYRKLIDLRHQEPALRVGKFISVGLENQLMVYERQFEKSKLRILVNFSKEPAQHSLPADETGELLLSTTGNEAGQSATNRWQVGGEEALILRISEPANA
jgi:alpha-glucosidase